MTPTAPDLNDILRTELSHIFLLSMPSYACIITKHLYILIYLLMEVLPKFWHTKMSDIYAETN